MGECIGVFERKEVKYVLSEAQYQQFRALIDPYMALDEYGETRVNSVYFDTPQRELIERSLDKPLYKEKLRMRWYERSDKGDGAEVLVGAKQTEQDVQVAQDAQNAQAGPCVAADVVFVELKKKFKGIVYKRRVSCTRDAAQRYLSGVYAYEQAVSAFPLDANVVAEAELSPRSVQIAREIDAFCSRWGTLRPSMLISCVRSALALREAFAAQENVRITFDAHLTYRDLALAGESDAFACTDSPGADCAILDPTRVVMEIKVAGPYPLWLVDALDVCDIRPQSFSKYGEAYKKSSKARVMRKNAQVRKEERCA